MLRKDSKLRNWGPYLFGSFGINLILITMSMMLIFRYAPGVANEKKFPNLLSSWIVGAILLFSRFITALLQPAIGYLSEKATWKWGKRRPLMAIGIFPMIFSFYLLFNPFDPNKVNLSIYLTLIITVFYLAFSFYFVPYLAWLPSLAPTSQEKIKLSSLMGIAMLFGVVLGGASAPLLIDKFGFFEMSVVISFIGGISLSIPLFVKEEPCFPIGVLPFWESIRLVLSENWFKRYLCGIFLVMMTTTMISVFTPYWVVALFQKKISFCAVLNILSLVGILIGFPLVLRLTKEMEKQKVFQVCMFWMSIGFFFIFLLLFYHPILISIILLFFITSCGLAGFFILPNAILADYITREKAEKKANLDGIYFGLREIIRAFGIGMGYCISGILLLFGKTSEQTFGIHFSFLIMALLTLFAGIIFKFKK